MAEMTIGRAAKAAGVRIATIRFYERRGLIAQPPKPESGYRIYPSGTVTRIHFIREAQEIGFSLAEVAELLALRADPQADCADVRGRAIEKRAEVQAKLAQLSRMQDALDELIASCPGGGDVKACTILDAMQRDPAGADTAASATPFTSAKGPRDMKTTILTIEGMHCDGCARTIEALLGRVTGVRKAEASFDERQARVLHDQATASATDLTAAIAKGGFTAKASER